MAFPEPLSLHHITSDQLSEIQSMVNDGHHAEALTVVQNAKAAYPHNIFIIALEKQLEKLGGLAKSNGQSDTQQQEILDSLANLIARAVQGMQSAKPAPEPTRDSPSMGADERTAKKAALEKLKNQYFHMAEDYFKKGNYKYSLIEIRRVKIVDPGNQMAEAYERKLEQLLELQQRKAPPDSVSPDRHDEEPVPADQPFSPVSAPPAPGKMLVFGDETEIQVNPREVRAEVATTKSRKPLSLVLTAVAIFVAVIVLVVYFFPSKGKTSGALPEPIVTQVMPATPAEPDVKPETQKGGASESTTSAQTNEEQAVSPKNPSPEKQVRIQAVKRVASTPSANKRSQNATPEPNNQSPPQVRKLAAKMDLSKKTSGIPAGTAYTKERGPEIIRLEAPDYPEAAWNKWISGEVIARVLINTKGEPVRVKIVKSTNPIFDDVVTEAVMNSEYSPGVMSNGPVTTWINIPFSFKRK